MPYCAVCGAQLNSEAIYCPACGSKAPSASNETVAPSARSSASLGEIRLPILGIIGALLSLIGFFMPWYYRLSLFDGVSHMNRAPENVIFLVIPILMAIAMLKAVIIRGPQDRKSAGKIMLLASLACLVLVVAMLLFTDLGAEMASGAVISIGAYIILGISGFQQIFMKTHQNP